MKCEVRWPINGEPMDRCGNEATHWATSTRSGDTYRVCAVHSQSAAWLVYTVDSCGKHNHPGEPLWIMESFESRNALRYRWVEVDGFQPYAVVGEIIPKRERTEITSPGAPEESAKTKSTPERSDTLTNHWSKKEPSREDQNLILKLFLEGHGVNHIIYLLNYAFNADVVNHVIREELHSLTTAIEETPMVGRDTQAAYVEPRNCHCPAEVYEEVGPICPICDGKRSSLTLP